MSPKHLRKTYQLFTFILTKMTKTIRWKWQKLTTARLKVRQPEIKELGAKRQRKTEKDSGLDQKCRNHITSLNHWLELQTFMLPGKNTSQTYLSRPSRKALNLCLLCLSWGSSPTLTCRLYRAWVLSPWQMGGDDGEEIHMKRGRENTKRENYRSEYKMHWSFGT